MIDLEVGQVITARIRFNNSGLGGGIKWLDDARLVKKVVRYEL